MSFLGKIDDFLIDKVFEPVSDWSNERYGSTNYLIAGLCAIGYLIAYCTGYALREERGMADILFGGFICLMLLYGIHLLLQLHELTVEMMRAPTANSMRYTFRFGRIMLLVLTAFFFLPTDILTDIHGEGLRKWAEIGRDIFAVCAVYFASCTTKPPKPKVVLEEKPALEGI